MDVELKYAAVVQAEALINQKLNDLRTRMKELQEAANSDSKSSMGDKYETGRAMVHLEQENLASQQSQLELQLKVLSQMSTIKHKTAQLGSLVKTNQGIFFLSIGLGNQSINNISIFYIAPTSPIGQKLIGLKKGDLVDFNGRQFKVVNVI